MRGIPFFSSLITVLPSLGEREHTTNSHTKPRRLSRSQLSPSDSPATFSSPNTCRRHRVVCPSSISATAAADANNSSARRVYIKLHSSIHPFIHSLARPSSKLLLAAQAAHLFATAVAATAATAATAAAAVVEAAVHE